LYSVGRVEARKQSRRGRAMLVSVKTLSHFLAARRADRPGTRVNPFEYPGNHIRHGSSQGGQVGQARRCAQSESMRSINSCSWEVFASSRLSVLGEIVSALQSDRDFQGFMGCATRAR
jgi:hypothetical protein